MMNLETCIGVKAELWALLDVTDAHGRGRNSVLRTRRSPDFVTAC